MIKRPNNINVKGINNFIIKLRFIIFKQISNKKNPIMIPIISNLILFLLNKSIMHGIIIKNVQKPLKNILIFIILNEFSPTTIPKIISKVDHSILLILLINIPPPLL